jgi:hypothetical protein
MTEVKGRIEPSRASKKGSLQESPDKIVCTKISS